MICVGSNELTDGPGGANKFACQTAVNRMGNITTIIKTRVAWIKEMERTFAPASSPKTIMSCKPPGMDA